LWLILVMKFLVYMFSVQLFSLVMELSSPGFQLSFIPNTHCVQVLLGLCSLTLCRP
jgi:hypothetical protein